MQKQCSMAEVFRKPNTSFCEVSYFLCVGCLELFTACSIWLCASVSSLCTFLAANATDFVVQKRLKWLSWKTWAMMLMSTTLGRTNFSGGPKGKRHRQRDRGQLFSSKKCFDPGIDHFCNGRLPAEHHRQVHAGVSSHQKWCSSCMVRSRTIGRCA